MAGQSRMIEMIASYENFIGVASEDTSAAQKGMYLAVPLLPPSGACGRAKDKLFRSRAKMVEHTSLLASANEESMSGKRHCHGRLQAGGTRLDPELGLSIFGP
jgi:hypothetical protein